MGCLSSLGSLRKGGFGDRFRGLAWDQLPATHCLRVQEGPACEERVGAEEREGNVLLIHSFYFEDRKGESSIKIKGQILQKNVQGIVDFIDEIKSRNLEMQDAY